MDSKQRSFRSSRANVGLFSTVINFFRQIRPVRSAPRPNPAGNYPEALERIEAIRQREDPQLRLARGKEALNVDCYTALYTHGKSVDRVIVFIHGFTNCPAQYKALAEQCLDRGYNVLVPRLPRHGYANRMTTALSLMTAEELVRSCEEAVDIAHGLGDHVTVVGLSLGGILASWLAQHRADIDRVVIISAAFTVHILPPWLNPIFAKILPLLPDFFRWWDAHAKEEGVGVPHAYPRFSIHSFAQLLRLGLLVQKSAQKVAPAARTIHVSMNPTDPSVNNLGAWQLIEHWRSHGTDVAVHQFEESWGLLHDFVDPTQPHARIEEVYPVLMELIEG